MSDHHPEGKAEMLREIIAEARIKGSDARAFIALDDWLEKIQFGDLVVIEADRVSPAVKGV